MSLGHLRIRKHAQRLTFTELTTSVHVLPHLIIPAAHAQLATHASAGGAVIYTHAVLETECTAGQTGVTFLLPNPALAITPKCSGNLSGL